MKSLAKKATELVNKEINKFSDWILSYIPNEIKNAVNKQVYNVKEQVNKIFNRIERFEPKQQQSALKAYRIDGQKGFDPKLSSPYGHKT